MKNSYETVLHFWFQELSPQDWWVKSEELDNKITNRFKDLHDKAVNGELYYWRENARGRLAEIIVLDQFSRNIYRDTPKSFQFDNMALTLSQEMLRNGLDKSLPNSFKLFCYLPYMHSESKIIHEEALRIFKAYGDTDFEIKHKVIIDRFGRYPHRNKILNRESTKEEIEFLKEPNSSF